jgi:dihydroneopterin aldolase
MCILDFSIEDMKNGIIELEGMRFWAFHGCLESERKKGNLFLVDFWGETDLSKAAESDDLNDTINYAAIHEIVKKEMSVPSDLLEHVAGRIIRAIAADFKEFTKFSIRISKHNPPVDGPVEWSRVTLNYEQ